MNGKKPVTDPVMGLTHGSRPANPLEPLATYLILEYLLSRRGEDQSKSENEASWPRPTGASPGIDANNPIFSFHTPLTPLGRALKSIVFR